MNVYLVSHRPNTWRVLLDEGHTLHDLGTYKDPECEACRRLQEMGYSGSVKFHRGGTHTMTADITRLATKRVADTDSSGGPRYVKWKPFDLGD